LSERNDRNEGQYLHVHSTVAEERFAEKLQYVISKEWLRVWFFNASSFPKVSVHDASGHWNAAKVDFDMFLGIEHYPAANLRV
jgi:hypothetical protein